MTPYLLGPYLLACSLLVIAGVSKLVRPLPTAVVVSRIFPSRRGRPERLSLPVRVLSFLEVLLGCAAAMYPHPLPAAAVAASYAAFGTFALYVRIRGGPDAGCGCFGSGDSDSAEDAETAPASGLHVSVDLAMAVSASSVAVAQANGTVFSLLAKQRLDGIPLLAACAVGTWLVVLWLVALPRLSRARRLVEQLP